MPFRDLPFPKKEMEGKSGERGGMGELGGMEGGKNMVGMYCQRKIYFQFKKGNLRLKSSSKQFVGRYLIQKSIITK